MNLYLKKMYFKKTSCKNNNDDLSKAFIILSSILPIGSKSGNHQLISSQVVSSLTIAV